MPSFLDRRRAKYLGMSIEDYMVFKEEMKKKETEKKKRLIELKMDEKYKRKEQRVKEGKSGFMGALEALGGEPQGPGARKGPGGPDIGGMLEVLTGNKSTGRKQQKKRRTKRRRRRR